MEEYECIYTTMRANCSFHVQPTDMQGDRLAYTCIIAFAIACMGYYLVSINTHNAMAIEAIQDQFFYTASRPTTSSHQASL